MAMKRSSNRESRALLVARNLTDAPVFDGPIRFSTNAAGYIMIYDPRWGKMRLLHRVVYEMKVGPIPEGWFVHHRDGDKRNNEPSNLEAVDPRRHPMGHAFYRRECELAKAGLIPKPGIITMPTDQLG